MKHTEGTLIAIGCEVQCPDEKYLIVADCFNRSLPDDGDANAQRVALCWNCHDDLLEACKHALRVFELYKNHPQMDTIREMLSKVITKAEAIK